jgi:tetratricopeptide (TPR) repeat protein
VAGDYPAAIVRMTEALTLFRDLGYRHGLASALNNLGELSCQTSAPQEARDRHGQALAIAREIGSPLEQARALAGIGMSLLPGRPAEATGQLREALAIFQRIGVPEARRVQDTLDEHGL